ncbi:Alpha/Beta hydrolase protein [Xylariaceae sp. FL0804]|nr:Alpha/Beta hydrolase protein [Xylariaceae sp. FL0804]
MLPRALRASKPPMFAESGSEPSGTVSSATRATESYCCSTVKTTRFPTVAEVVRSPAYSSAIWELEPHRSGFVPVAEGRGGPFNIHWEIHGDGPVKLALVNGMAVFKSSWQRQTLHFGHRHGDRFSVLVLDNRGMGRSDKPLRRYSTSEMAADVIEVLAHVGWTDPRQVNLCGISMGGMIAQEIAHAIPERIASLSLICTAAAIENTTGFLENLANRVSMLVPKSLDRSIAYSADAFFPFDWLAAPDEADVPDASTPRCAVPPGGYARFPDNYTRFAAAEIQKQRDPDGGFSKPGFLCQVIAAGWHHKSPEQLAALADVIGRERILVMHGTTDGIISTPHGEKLIEYLRPGKGLIVENMGHAPIVQKPKWFNDLLEEMCARGQEHGSKQGQS